MPKKEKEIELKVKAEKISEEHLVELKKLVNTVNGFNFNIGRVEVQKHELLHKLAIVHDEVSLYQDTLMKEYGSYDVNVVTGEINWPKAKNKPSPPIPPRDGKPSSNNVEKPKKDEK